jgi:hypothetical protein
LRTKPTSFVHFAASGCPGLSNSSCHTIVHPGRVGTPAHPASIANDIRPAHALHVFSYDLVPSLRLPDSQFSTPLSISRKQSPNTAGQRTGTPQRRIASSTSLGMQLKRSSRAANLDGIAASSV